MSTGGDPSFWQWGTLVGGAIAALLATVFGLNISKRNREHGDEGDKRDETIRALTEQLAKANSELSSVNLQREFETQLRRLKDDIAEVISAVQVSINDQLTELSERMSKLEARGREE